MFVCTCVSEYVCVHIYIYIYIHIYTYIHIYIHIYICIHPSIHPCMYGKVDWPAIWTWRSGVGVSFVVFRCKSRDPVQFFLQHVFGVW